MSVYAVIDTNVFVSAMLSKHSDAATVQLVCRIFMGEIIPVYSREIMREYREVLGRKKFKFEPEVVNYILSAIEKFGILAEPSETGVRLPDMKDLPFYEVAMEERDKDTYLVTGNLKHFPFEKFIVTARQMLDILEQSEKEK
jgi:putative PIN family toxin of toxin-antitoxin system